MAATLTAVPKDKQWSVIQCLMLENDSDSEIHMRKWVVYGAQNVITKLTVNQWVQRFEVISPEFYSATFFFFKINSRLYSYLTLQGTQKQKAHLRRYVTSVQHVLLKN